MNEIIILTKNVCIFCILNKNNSMSILDKFSFELKQYKFRGADNGIQTKIIPARFRRVYNEKLLNIISKMIEKIGFLFKTEPIIFCSKEYLQILIENKNFKKVIEIQQQEFNEDKDIETFLLNLSF